MPPQAERPRDDGTDASAFVGGSPIDSSDLAVQLSELARSLQGNDDPDEVLKEIVDAAVQLIPGVEDGSISVVLNRKEVGSRAASSDLPRKVDAAQMEIGQGPCLDAAYDEKTVRVHDMRHERRWPEFARRACEVGAGSMLAFQLFVDGNNLGALNLYAAEPEAFSDEAVHVGQLFATHAAVAYADVEKIEQLGEAMATRDLIGQAKGMLMERYTINGQQAFSLLTRASQTTNRKLRDVAEQLVQSRELRQR
ncbi:MAG TPA: GAF and ANTAR domain-containing protein [Nocardioidaceae bacterium]|nr:GAF and ANTAR domain-containing protein [Nocardioidaceae bacterium]